MIFLTVGHQIPFDRLVRAVDDWAGATGHTDIFAQIGIKAYKPQNMVYKDMISPVEFRQKVEEADAVVAHAGTGTILTALEVGTPILVMPRHAKLMETRNDHQVATARRFRDLGKVAVAMDESELPTMLEKLNEFNNKELLPPYASSELINAIKDFIQA